MAELKPVLLKKGDKLTIGINGDVHEELILNPLFLFLVPCDKQQQLADELKTTVYYPKETTTP